jgi:hypothetical protein
MEIALIVLAILLILTGIIGNIIPALPGTPLSFAGLLILDYTRQWEAFSAPTLVLFGVLTLASLAFDFIIPIFTAKRFGSTRHGMIWSFVGMIAGLIIFPPLGGMIGLVAGAIGGELYAGKRHGEALKAGAATVAGNIAAVVLRLGISIFMAVLFFTELLNR